LVRAQGRRAGLTHGPPFCRQRRTTDVPVERPDTRPRRRGSHTASLQRWMLSFSSSDMDLHILLLLTEQWRGLHSVLLFQRCRVIHTYDDPVGFSARERRGNGRQHGWIHRRTRPAGASIQVQIASLRPCLVPIPINPVNTKKSSHRIF